MAGIAEESRTQVLVDLNTSERLELVKWIFSGSDCTTQRKLIMMDGNESLLKLGLTLIDTDLIMFLLKLLTINQLSQCILKHDLLIYALTNEFMELVELIAIVYQCIESETKRCRLCGKCENCQESSRLKFRLRQDLSNNTIQENQWTCEAIRKFYGLQLPYFIPHNQDEAKMWAFICFNTFTKSETPKRHRDGAEKEAKDLGNCLNHAGFNMLCLRDWTARQLKRWLRDSVRAIRNQCSVLFLFLMSHGSEGVIHDNDDQPEKINNILLELEVVDGETEETEASKLHPNTPCVVIIQACQGQYVYKRFEKQLGNSFQQLGIRQHQPSTRDHLDDVSARDAIQQSVTSEQKTDEPRDAAKHPESEAKADALTAESSITLMREHTALYVATRPGYTSQRGFFIKHIGEQLSRSDGKTEFYQQYLGAIKEMESHPDPEHRAQVTDGRLLLRRPLILPATAAVRQKRQSESGEQLSTSDTGRCDLDESEGNNENSNSCADSNSVVSHTRKELIAKLVSSASEAREALGCLIKLGIVTLFGKLYEMKEGGGLPKMFRRKIQKKKDEDAGPD